MMGEHERRHVVRRLLSPPPLPALVGPGAAYRPEHVAAEDPRPESLHATSGNLVVHAGFAALHALHLAPGSRVEEPLHELFTTNAQRMLQILIRAGTESIDGDAEAADDET